MILCFFVNDTATTEIYPYLHTLSLHDALPISLSSYALAAARHMHQYGTTREQLAEVAVAARKWAQLNPEAFTRDPLTIDDVLGARMVSDPLTVRDCCLVPDGAAAVVMTRAARARDLRQTQIARAHVCTTVTNAHLVCRLLL